MGDERKETRRLRRPATEHEVATAAKELVRVMNEYDQLERDKKAEVEDWNERLKACDSGISSIRLTIESGEIEEDVECLATFDFGRNAVTVVRLDTGEVVQERAMTAEERQEREQAELPTLEASETPGTTDGKSAAAGETDEDEDDEGVGF